LINLSINARLIITGLLVMLLGLSLGGAA